MPVELCPECGSAEKTVPEIDYGQTTIDYAECGLNFQVG